MRILLALALFICLLTPAWAQGGKGPKYYPRGGKVLPAGVVYHAQLFPEKDWERDLAQIAKLGFSFVRLGEQAWPRLEPKEGGYDLAWLDRCVDLAARYKLKILLSTSTSAPPAWLMRLHPEFEALSANGHPYPLDQYCGSSASAAYQACVNRLTTALAKRYGDNTAIVGWIIDAPTAYDYGPKALAGFQAYMQEQAKGSIDTLNRRWGTMGTPLQHYAWEDIRLTDTKGYSGNTFASARRDLDFEQFSALQAAEVVNGQVDILKRLTLSQFVSSPYAGPGALSVPDPFLLRNQDFVSTSFPHSLAEHLQADSRWNRDVAASIQGRTGENALPVRMGSQPYVAGRLRLRIWQQYGLGQDYLCFTPYRLPHSNFGIMTSDGVTVSPMGAEILETLAKIELLKGYRMLEAVEPLMLSKLKTAIVFRPEQAKRVSEAPTTLQLLYQDIVEAGAPIRFVEPGLLLDPKEYPFLLVPGAEQATVSQVAGWRRYVQAGGHLLLVAEARSGYDVLASQATSALARLTGAKPAILPEQGLEILGSHKDSVGTFPPTSTTENTPLRGVIREFVPGTLLYLDNPDAKTIHTAVEALYNRAAVASMRLQPGVSVQWHEGLLVVVNASREEFKAAFPSVERIEGVGPDIKAGDVGVFKLYK